MPSVSNISNPPAVNVIQKSLALKHSYLEALYNFQNKDDECICQLSETVRNSAQCVGHQLTVCAFK